MAGANYMGGRRNAARARFKDADGKAQRGHFMKQRHLLLTRALQDRGSLNNEDKKTRQAQKREEISFAHARKDIGHDQSLRRVDRSYIPFTRELVHKTSSPGRNMDRVINQSKLLEKLEIEDRLRLTMNKLLRLPDLAGLSGLYSTLSRRNESKARDSESRMRKRQRTESFGSDESGGLALSPRKQREPNEPIERPKEYNIESLNNPVSPFSEDPLAGYSVASSRSPSTGDTCIAEYSLPSDQFSTTLECATPDHSSFSELTFSDVLSSQAASPIKLDAGKHLAPKTYMAPSPAGRTRSRSIPRRSESPSSDCSQPSTLPTAYATRPTFTLKRYTNQPIVPAYFSSSADDNGVPLEATTNSAFKRSPERKYSFVSLLEVEDPWRFLDGILSLQPARDTGEGGSSFDKFTGSDRAGLGYKGTTLAARWNFPRATNSHGDNSPTPRAVAKISTLSTSNPNLVSRVLEVNEGSPTMTASDDVDDQPRTTSVSAKEILPMKRHLLSAAASINLTREPFIASGGVTSVLGSSSPRLLSSPESPQSSFPSPTGLGGEFRLDRTALIDLPFRTNETMDTTKHQVPSVSETVRQLLSSPQLQPMSSERQFPSLIAQPSSPTNHTVNHDGPALTHYRAEGPELFAGMDDDDE